jgi:hypothetical protein
MTVHRLYWLVLYSLSFFAEAIRFAFKPPFVRPTSPIQLECCPLIGGPKFAPLHVQVVVLDQENAKHRFDFIPQDATKPETLTRILSLQAVPGNLRYLAPNVGGVSPTSSKWVQRARDFTTQYENTNLQLMTNNCWTFAWKLVQYLEHEEGN